MSSVNTLALVRGIEDPDLFRQIIQGDDCVNTLLGSSGRDRLFGLGDDDVIYDGEGLDTMRGGDGADTFIFAQDFKNDSVLDYDPDEGDLINLSAFSVFDFADLSIEEEVRQAPNGTDLYRVKVQTGDETLYLRNEAWSFRASDLTADQFLFGPAPQGPTIVQGTNRSDIVRGTAADEILVDLGGIDKLYGGAGVDQFTLYADGLTDYIKDYQAGEVVDITRWEITGTDDLDIFRTHQGKLFVRYDDEVLVVQGARTDDGIAALEVEAFLDSLIF